MPSNTPFFVLNEGMSFKYQMSVTGYRHEKKWHVDINIDVEI